MAAERTTPGTELSPRAPDELRALSKLAHAEVAAFIGGIGSFERAIAGRTFGALDRATRAFPPLAIGTWPARTAYGAAERAVVGAIRGGHVVGGRLDLADRGAPT